MATCKKACAWQAPQLPLQVVMLGGQRDREALLPRLDSESKAKLCILANNNKGHIAQIVFQISSPEGIRAGKFATVSKNGKVSRAPARKFGA